MKYYIEETNSYYHLPNHIQRTQVSNAIGCMVQWCLGQSHVLKFMKQQVQDPYEYQDRIEFQKILEVFPTLKQDDSAYSLTYFLSIIFESNGERYLKFIKRYQHELYLELSRSDMDNQIYVLDTLPDNANSLSEFELRRRMGFLIFNNIFDPQNEVIAVFPNEDMISRTLQWQYEQITENINVNLKHPNILPKTKRGIKFTGNLTPESILSTDEAIQSKLIVTKNFLRYLQKPAINFDFEPIHELKYFNNEFDNYWNQFELPFDDSYELLKRQFLFLQPLFEELNQLRTLYHENSSMSLKENIQELEDDLKKSETRLKEYRKDIHSLQNKNQNLEKALENAYKENAQLDGLRQAKVENEAFIELLQQQIKALSSQVSLQTSETKEDLPQINDIIQKLKTKKILIVSGSNSWNNKLKEVLDAEVLDVNKEWNKESVNVDLIIFNTQVNNHRTFYRIKQNISVQTKIVYVNESTNINRILYEIEQQL